MGLSYLKSKRPILVSCQTLCSSKIASHQGKLQKVIARFGSQGISLLLAQKKSHKHPINLSTHVRNKVGIFSSVMCLVGSKAMNSRFFFDAGRRFFHGNRPQVQVHTKETRLVIPSMQRALGQIQREVPWGQLLRDPRFLVIGSCVLIALLFGRIERVPISGRFHLVLSCKALERKLGEWQFKKQEEEHHGRILPPSSPESIRVQRILREIVQGMHSGLRLEKDCRVRVHECQNPAKLTPRGRSRKEKKPLEEQLSSGSDQLVCHKTKERIQKKARKFGWRFATKHLDGLNWEVMVVDSYTSNACYIPNGKIVIFTGLVNKLKSDAEVAAVLGHEVGHGIARHITENLFRILWVLISLILCPLPDEIGPQFHPINFLLFFISRRREMEADYIGMMLMASAGYDPRVAPGVELKIDDRDHHSVFSTHPCGRKRAKKLENAEVMDQAMAIHKDVKCGFGVKSFV